MSAADEPAAAEHPPPDHDDRLVLQHERDRLRQELNFHAAMLRARQREIDRIEDRLGRR